MNLTDLTGPTSQASAGHQGVSRGEQGAEFGADGFLRAFVEEGATQGEPAGAHETDGSGEASASDQAHGADGAGLAAVLIDGADRFGVPRVSGVVVEDQAIAAPGDPEVSAVPGTSALAGPAVSSITTSSQSPATAAAAEATTMADLASHGPGGKVEPGSASANVVAPTAGEPDILNAGTRADVARVVHGPAITTDLPSASKVGEPANHPAASGMIVLRGQYLAETAAPTGPSRADGTQAGGHAMAPDPAPGADAARQAAAMRIAQSAAGDGSDVRAAPELRPAGRDAGGAEPAGAEAVTARMQAAGTTAGVGSPGVTGIASPQNGTLTLAVSSPGPKDAAKAPGQDVRAPAEPALTDLPEVARVKEPGATGDGGLRDEPRFSSANGAHGRLTAGPVQVLGGGEPGPGAGVAFTAQTTSGGPVTAPANPVAAERAVIAQVTAAVQPGVAPGRIEVTLDPPELGRVEIAIDVSEHALKATLTADRQATGDLIRRHLDLLTTQFREAGFTDVDLSYSGRRGGAPQHRGDGSDPSALHGPIPAEVPAIPQVKPQHEPITASGRLDIRL